MQLCGVAVLLLAFVSLGECQTRTVWSWSSYPNPQTDVNECGRNGKKSSVCDPNNIITGESADQIDKLIDTLKNNTKCPCASHSCAFKPWGYRVGVALLNKIDTDEIEMSAKLGLAEEFAYNLQQKWELGECNEDVIIVYSREDNVFYTMVGTEAGKKLTANDVGAISMSANTNFGLGNVFEGLTTLISKYQDVFNGHYERQQIDDEAPAVGRSQTSASTRLMSCILGTIMLLGASLLLH